MFSVYGKAGHVFSGSMEDLHKVGPVSALARTRAVEPIERDPLGESTSHFVEMSQSTPKDIPHRSAVAAYSQTLKAEPERHPLTRVEHIMNRAVISIADTATVGEAWDLLFKKHRGQAPVVNRQGTLVGLLSRAELLHPDRLPGPNQHPLVWKALLSQSVVDIMWSPVPSVHAETDIRRLARVLIDTGLPGLPVVDDHGQVIAFVSRTDVLKAVVADPPLDLWS